MRNFEAPHARRIATFIGDIKELQMENKQCGSLDRVPFYILCSNNSDTTVGRFTGQGEEKIMKFRSKASSHLNVNAIILAIEYLFEY